jgi:hypothetical protein
MAKATKRSSRGRKQDRARVTGGQHYEVSFTGNKMRKKAIKKVGTSPKRVKRRHVRNAI